eukprot:2014318-Amphidinium_carterae.1
MIIALNWLCSGGASSEELVMTTTGPCSCAQLSLMQPLITELRAWCRSDGGAPLPADGGLPRVLSTLRRQMGDKSLTSAYACLHVSHDELFAGTTVTQELSPTSMALPSISAQTPLQVPTVPREIQEALEEEYAFLLPDPPE